MSNKRQIARRIKKEIRAEDCSEIAVEAINRHLTISINGKLNQKTIIRSLVGMSANKLSVHSINKAVEKVPCETSVRYHLSKVDLDSLLALQSKILTYSNDQILVPRKSHHFAIDFTDDPYYGECVDVNKDYVIKSKMKDSTTTFYSYVSLYITTKGQRLTLAVLPVKKGVSKVEYIRKFLVFIDDAKVNIEVLCLDRGFYSNDVLSFLQKENIPHIVPVKKDGQELKKILRGNHSRYARYTMRGTSGPLDLTLAIDVQYLQGRNKKFGNVNLGYVVYGIDWKPRRVYQVYKNRFAIESSYRIRNIVKAKTSSRNVVLRYLLTIISFLLKNIWVALQWMVFSKVQRGPRSINNDLFRFDLFRLFVWEEVKTERIFFFIRWAFCRLLDICGARCLFRSYALLETGLKISEVLGSGISYRSPEDRYMAPVKCPFCNPIAEDIVARNELCYALWDRFPVSRGHTLVVPFRHTPDFFSTTVEEKAAVMALITSRKDVIEENFSPAGYNIGFNVGTAAGQTVMHCHCHVIPRYVGDVPEPRGGVRGVVPGKRGD